MKKILILLIMMLSVVSYSQIANEYPRIEIDSSGRKVVVMTIEQAQKIDNNGDLLELLKKKGVDCDNSINACLKVVDDQNKVISIFELEVKTLKSQLTTKTLQIENIQNQYDNEKSSNLKCEEQKKNDEKVNKILKDEIRKQKNQKIIGFITTGIAVVGIILLVL